MLSIKESETVTSAEKLCMQFIYSAFQRHVIIDQPMGANNGNLQ